ncbi:MAG: sigma-54 dependent transcriptional regulator [Pseudomonadota bacterium]|nr:sigma-54-dependent Fis family transcriptional regulator [Magnetococcales bacterium]MEC8066943.1 sigma-54 dependent transcriptional regulator [Pseudomonadota bacterium]MEC8467189.1 sigma-54 dependent transcriptional regulator [Pseudomonadota bacterium]|tara:strand:- start:20492 stop:21823 length:1332 start_codon:yes stop_codon:yes gene_type:complete
MGYEILIVDDEADIRSSISGLLEDEGYRTRTAASGQEALDMVAERLPNLVLLDIWMDGMDGLEVLSRLKRRVPDLPIIMISGHGTIETAVQATQKGAYDFIEKPPQADRLILTCSRAVQDAQLRKENLLLRSRNGDVQELLGVSSEIATVRQAVKQVAQGDSRVMVTGESGAGKEVVARLIHKNSQRRERPFVCLSPAAVSDTTFEMALNSMLAQATGGTLFLDEVADLHGPMQARLLKFLQEGFLVDPRSGARIEADVRIISSTSKNIKSLVEAGTFRADLFYRLNVVPIEVPALRIRSMDIPSLVQHFLRILSPDAASIPKIAPATMAVLTSYQWPGNVRQLKNLIEWLIIMHPGRMIVPDMLPPEMTKSEALDLNMMEKVSTLPLRQAREIFEKSYLANQLQRFSGNVSRTADFVGMERSALHRKLKSLGVESRDLTGLN